MLRSYKKHFNHTRKNTDSFSPFSYPIIQKYVINPYYESKGEVNPELENASSENEDDAIFEDKGGSEKPIESRKKSKGKIIS